MQLTDTLIDALHFAAQRHRDQRRKDVARSPYVNHLIEVLRLLWHQGGIRDEAILAAGLLHDTVEDTDTRPEELAERFGPEVRDLVLEVTDDKALEKATRKRLQIEHAPHKSPGAACIKLADKSSNVYDISHTPPADWSEERLLAYLDWAEAVVSSLPPANSGLLAHFQRTLTAGRRRLAEKKSPA
jgi:guanosine-3',5'-bis(diphosphate) 3'-pyrophosphohydrolase